MKKLLLLLVLIPLGGCARKAVPVKGSNAVQWLDCNGGSCLDFAPYTGNWATRLRVALPGQCAYMLDVQTPQFHYASELDCNAKEVFHRTDSGKAWYAKGWNEQRVNDALAEMLARINRAQLHEITDREMYQ